MSFFRSAVAIATMLMGIDFAFAEGCGNSEKVDSAHLPEILVKYSKDYHLNMSRFDILSIHTDSNRKPCSEVDLIVAPNTKVLFLYQDHNGGSDLTANVLEVSEDNGISIIEHPQTLGGSPQAFALLKR